MAARGSWNDNKLWKQAEAELCQAQVKLEVIVEAELYLELKMKLATTILCDWVDKNYANLN